MRVFRLPDLGEGLQDAEIVEWHVAAGAEVAQDQPLLAVETAKAVVDIPSPRAGTIARLCGRPGEILKVGDPLVEYAGEASESGGAGGASVVGTIEQTAEVNVERPVAVGRPAARVTATPAVRALASRLGVDLGVVTPSGPDDTITAADVERVARIFKELGPIEPLRGVRRTMARAMAQAHAEVVPVTINDDADIVGWREDEDVTLRLIRAIVVACKAEPALNAWYDSHAMGRRVLEKIHLGIAVDTPSGLFVPVLRDVGNRAPADIRRGLEALRRDVQQRTIPPEAMRGYTFTLSNFGTIGGRYANPIVQPPTVAILGAGRAREEVVAVGGEAAVHTILPLSLTFDHRSVTGGEATRFLAAAIADLQRS